MHSDNRPLVFQIIILPGFDQTGKRLGINDRLLAFLPHQAWGNNHQWQQANT
jgi:hypothetical protein